MGKGAWKSAWVFASSLFLTGPAWADLYMDLIAGRYALVDLTHVVDEQIPYWPGGIPFRMERLADYEKEGYRFHTFIMGENTGTHVDAPSHFVKGTASIDLIPVQDLILPAVVVDVEAKVEKDPDYQLSVQDLLEWEARYGPIPMGALVIMRTGWFRRWPDTKAYRNMDEKGIMHFPGVSVEAARFLLQERSIKAIGIDTLSLDYGPSRDFATHFLVLGAGRYQIENLANLDRLPPRGAVVFVGVWRLREGTQAPARVVAFVPRP